MVPISNLHKQSFHLEFGKTSGSYIGYLLCHIYSSRCLGLKRHLNQITAGIGRTRQFVAVGDLPKSQPGQTGNTREWVTDYILRSQPQRSVLYVFPCQTKYIITPARTVTLVITIISSLC